MDRLVGIFKKAFLPHGYPYTVSRDYAAYQVWDSLQAFASSIMNILATHAVLKGVGVGDENATVLAATITFILRDGTSIIGSLIFATMKCHQLDSDCKRWRLFADVLNDVAICIDLLSCNAHYFQIVQCISGLSRSLVGIAGGATRAAITQHQAINNNMADVSAKDNSQERIVNLMALLVAYLMVPYIASHVRLIWLCYAMFTILHLYANYRAVRAVAMDIFNAQRLAIFFNDLLTRDPRKPLPMSIESVNQQENVWFYNPFDKFDCFNNVSIVIMLKSTVLDLKSLKLVKIFEDPKGEFIVTTSNFTSETNVWKMPTKIFIFQSDATAREIQSSQVIRVLFLLFIVKWSTNLRSNEDPTFHKIRKIQEQKADAFVANSREQFKLALDYSQASEQNLFDSLRTNGWRTDHLIMPEIIEISREISENDYKKRQ